jgi:hypothetical protein
VAGSGAGCEHAFVSVVTREIRALYCAETITVYQAYSPEIATLAAAQGRFPDGYGRGRMAWIKPSFLWMMYRSSWGSAVGQERVLAIRIRRDGFEWALAHSALSGYDGHVHTSRDQWKREIRRSPVRIQWDLERDLNLQPLVARSASLSSHQQQSLIRIRPGTFTSGSGCSVTRACGTGACTTLVTRRRPSCS